MTNVEAEPCGWVIVSRYPHTCLQPSVGYVTRGQLEAAVCARHRGHAHDAGFTDTTGDEG